eukprot:219242-Pyramimonas_sp.AAC.1
MIPYVKGPAHMDSLCGWAFQCQLLMWRGLHILIPSVEGPPHIDSFCGGRSPFPLPPPSAPPPPPSLTPAQ